MLHNWPSSCPAYRAWRHNRQEDSGSRVRPLLTGCDDSKSLAAHAPPLEKPCTTCAPYQIFKTRRSDTVPTPITVAIHYVFSESRLKLMGEQHRKQSDCRHCYRKLSRSLNQSGALQSKSFCIVTTTWNANGSTRLCMFWSPTEAMWQLRYGMSFHEHGPKTFTGTDCISLKYDDAEPCTMAWECSIPEPGLLVIRYYGIGLPAGGYASNAIHCECSTLQVLPAAS